MANMSNKVLKIDISDERVEDIDRFPRYVEKIVFYRHVRSI